MVRARLVVPVTVGALVLGFVPTSAVSAQTGAPEPREGTSAFASASTSTSQPRAQVPGVETVGPIGVASGSGPLVALGPPPLSVVPDGGVVNPVQP